MGAKGSEMDAPGPPRYLQHVLLELLVMCGMDRQLGFCTNRLPTSVRMLPQPPALDPLAQAREYLRRRSWRSGLFELNAQLIAACGVFVTSSVALNKTHGTDPATLALLALVSGLASYLCWAGWRYWRRLSARLTSGLLYSRWLHMLAEGPAALDELEPASPFIGRLFAMWGRPKSLGAMARYATLGVDWSAAQPRLSFKYEWAVLLFVLALNGLSLVYAWLDLCAAMSQSYYFYSVVLFSMAGWLSVLVAGASRNYALLSYLIECLARHLQQEAATSSSQPQSAGEPQLA